MPADNVAPPPPGGGVNRRFATLRATSALILREMATRYGNSPGGYIWALLEPVGVIIIMAVGFSLIMRSPALGSSFILFYATGFLPFNLYQTVSNMMARSIPFSRPLLFYPAVTWVDAVLARFALNALTGILVMIILMAAIIMVTDTPLVLSVIPVLIAIGLALLLGAGFGMLNSALIGLFPVWGQVWSIATRPLFLVSGVIFMYEDMPPLAQSILWYNPLMHVAGWAREGFYPTYSADYTNAGFVIATSLIPLFLGTVLMGRFHREILNS